MQDCLKVWVLTVRGHQHNILPPANEVWGKVIFSHASVSHPVHRGVSASGSRGCLPLSPEVCVDTPPWTYLLDAHPFLDTDPSWTQTSHTQTPDTHTDPRHTHTHTHTHTPWTHTPLIHTHTHTHTPDTHTHTPWTHTPLIHTHTHTHTWSTSGHYASYWNAFLFAIISRNPYLTEKKW